MRQISVPTHHHVHDRDNLTDLIHHAAAATPQRPLFRNRAGRGWQDVSAHSFLEQVNALAQGLIAAGISVGDRVGLMAKTRYEWVLFDFALWSVGAISVPIYDTSSADQLSWILHDSQAVGVVVETDHHRALVNAVRPELRHLQHVWQIDQNCVPQLVSIGVGVPAQLLRECTEALRADDVATLIYTSGTTGRPKGCQLSHRNLLSVVHNAVEYAREVFEPKNASTVMFLPLAHVLARAVQLMCVAGGIRTTFSREVKDLSRELAEVQPTFVLAVPRVFEKLHERMQQQACSGAKARLFRAASSCAIAYSQALDTNPRRPGRSAVPVLLRARHRLFSLLVYRKIHHALGGRLGICVSGGAALHSQLQHFFRGVGVHIIEGYGLTETSSATNVNVVRTNRIGTVGRPLPGVSMRIDGDGQIRVKGDTVFRGYHNNPAATAAEFDEDGYFLTGDLGSLDDQGFLTLTGRAKELLVTAGGKNVVPGPLEDSLRGHPLISQAMVLGDGRPYIACLLTLSADALPSWLQRHGLDPALTPAQLVDNPSLLADLQQGVDRANSSVSQAESIKRFVVLPVDFTQDQGQLTPSLKLKRAVIAEQFAEQIEAMYARPRDS